MVTDLRGVDGSDTLVGIEQLRFLGGYGSNTDAVLRHLYEGLLQRSPTSSELSYWSELHASRLTLAELASTLANSPEALERHATSSDAQFVAGLYQSVLGRAGSGAEIAYWSGLIAGGVARGTVALGFASASEASARTMAVEHSTVGVLTRMYQSMFDRAPDEAGLNYWLEVHQQGLSLGTSADGFAASFESTQQGTVNNRAAFIAHLFQSSLRRAPSATEQNTLLDQLNSGVFDQGQVLLNLTDSPEHVSLIGVGGWGGGL